MIIFYTKDDNSFKTLNTPCPYCKPCNGSMAGSIICQQCRFNKKTDIKNQFVECINNNKEEIQIEKICK